MPCSAAQSRPHPCTNCVCPHRLPPPWFPALPPPPGLQSTQPRGIIEVNKCLSIKGAEDAINKPHAFEISTTDQNMYFIADSDKVRLCWLGVAWCFVSFRALASSIDARAPVHLCLLCAHSAAARQAVPVALPALPSGHSSTCSAQLA